VDFTNNQEIVLLLIYEGGIGPQGSIGFQGIAGIAGTQGNQGRQGIAGIAGTQGNQGRQGTAGNIAYSEVIPVAPTLNSFMTSLGLTITTIPTYRIVRVENNVQLQGGFQINIPNNINVPNNFSKASVSTVFACGR
jgi:hypothetical protein